MANDTAQTVDDKPWSVGGRVLARGYEAGAMNVTMRRAVRSLRRGLLFTPDQEDRPHRRDGNAWRSASWATLRASCWAVAVLLVTAQTAAAAVNLQWRPVAAASYVGDIVRLGLYAVSDDPVADRQFGAIDMVFEWDPTALQLLGVDATGAVGLLASGFPVDPFNLNEAFPPQDGDGLYQAFAALGRPVAATPEGTLITTFEFRALSVTPNTEVLMLVASQGMPQAFTTVWDAVVPNTPITGTLSSAGVAIRLRGDFDGNGVVDVRDVRGFENCMIGPGVAAGEQCRAAMFDSDSDVDFVDWVPFQNVVAGSGR